MQVMEQKSALKLVPTTCSYCSLQCGINLNVTAQGLAVKVTARPDFPVTLGHICGKGQLCHEELAHPDRLTRPLLRSKSGLLEPAVWEDALTHVVERIQAIQAAYGKDAVAFYSGGCLSNEKSYLIGKFARLALGTRNIDYNGRFCMSSAAVAQNKAFGLDRGLNFPLSDIPRASCIILSGTNLGEAQPPMMFWLNQARKAGARIIATDPRQTPTTRFADKHLPLRPGTDLALMNGLLHICIRDGYLDPAFIAEQTNNFEAVRAAVASYTPEVVAAITGLDPAEIEESARWFGQAERGMILSARGAEQHSKGVDTVLAHINLALATGNSGRPGTGYGTITGQANGQGGREHGLKADQLPGYRSIEDPAHRGEIASIWGCDEAEIPGKGLPAVEMFDAMLTGEIRALVLLGSNPLVSAPNLSKVTAALAGLDLLVVIDFFPSETAGLAHVVLPGNMWAEEEGTVTNLEGRVILRRQAVNSPAGARSDVSILLELARGLGKQRYFSYDSVHELFNEFRRATSGSRADYSGMTWERIEANDGLFWPCPAESHPGTPRPFATRFAHPDGRALFHPVEHRCAGEEPDQQYPWFLTTGRVAAHYQSGNQTRRNPRLNRRSPEPFAEMHPDLAARCGLKAGAQATLTTRRGRATFPVKLNPGMRADTVFLPFHWGGAQAANQLVNPAMDPISRMPEFKICAVKITA